MTAAYDGSRVSRKAASETPAANSRHPAAAIQPAPMRRDMRWPTAAKIGTIAGPTATPRPVRSAE